MKGTIIFPDRHAHISVYSLNRLDIFLTIMLFQENGKSPTSYPTENEHRDITSDKMDSKLDQMPLNMMCKIKVSIQMSDSKCHFTDSIFLGQYNHDN